MDGLLESIGLKDSEVGVAGKMPSIGAREGADFRHHGRITPYVGSRRVSNRAMLKLTAVEAPVMLFIVPLLFS